MRPRLSPLVLLASITALHLGSPGAFAGGPSPSPVGVVELFTSQGCSSCPPADALMHEYAGRPDVVALTLPVDYWDYLGWKDTLASPKFTARQRAYAKTRGDGEVYTPQVVINGFKHVIGSHRDEIDRALERARAALAPKQVAAQVRLDGSAITIDIAPGSAGEQAGSGTVWLAVVQPSVEVEIARGENKGRKITYYNVVRELMPVGSWSGQAATIRLEQSAVLRDARDRCAVLVQQGTYGAIVGAAWMAGRR